MKEYNYKYCGIQTENHIDFGLNEIILSEDFVEVANINDIQPLHMKEVEVDGENICLVNVEGRYMLLAVSAHMKVVL